MGKVSWSLASSTDRDYIFELAIEKGWLEKPPKVQVKRYPGMEEWYVIEPYEEDCNCLNLVYPPTGEKQMEEKEMLDAIEQRIKEARIEKGEKLSQEEKDREYLFRLILVALDETIHNILLSATPNMENMDNPPRIYRPIG